MIRLLLNRFFHALKSLQVQITIMVNPERTKAVLVFVLLMGLASSNTVFGQQVDTWFRAGKGVNSPTFPLNYADPLPLPPADGTPVTTWYDIVYTVQQNLIPNPNPTHYPNPWFIPVNPGFDYPYPNSGSYDLFLTPTGSIPGLPTLRRNLLSNINFNPVVNFDGSGDGQALHFRSDSRQDVTVFVVFRAQGAGNSAETQRLLFGGDIENHHTSFNQDEWTTNLSLGLADGNVFSVGRTWEGDGGGFFQPGSIDLMGLPSIGTFTRSTSVDSERLETYVNGLNDIGVNRNHALADNPLFFFNRVGKHFNSNDSNRNLTGDIAEILLADFSLSMTQRQMVESYLAIKYGITLNRAGQLGSIVGNLGYPYLASDGTVIWDPALDSNYRFDIAGLGRDRFDDTVGGLSLRYDQHQRISQSVNSGAIVAMSTNTSFATDNLDQSRTEIDNTTGGAPSLNSHLHNYLIWASDRGSINQTAVELPDGYSARIEREWKIQKTVSPGVDPINGVSVRIDLSGSDILSNPNCRTLALLIDNDGDGNFLTGIPTSIPATSIDGANNAYFDNVTFEHTQVFTVAVVDTTPTVTLDTSSGPTTCGGNDGSIALQFTNVPAGSYTIDYEDGSNNPQTFTDVAVDNAGEATITALSAGTYNSITITVNGCTSTEDVDVTLSDPATPAAPVADDQAFCSADSPTGDDLVPAISASITWYSDAALSNEVADTDALLAQDYYVTQTVNGCESAPTTVAVAVNATPAAPDADDQAFCSADSPTGDDLEPAISASITWYSDALLSNEVADTDALLAQDYYVTQTVNGCESEPTTVAVTINPQVTANAGIDGILYTCGEAMFTEVDLFNALRGTPDSGGTWSPAPSGPGVYTYTVAANGNCSTSAMAQVTVIEENIGAFVEPIYACDGNNSISNSIQVTLADPSIADNLMYALDSTNPNDFVLNPDFFNISAGEHTLFIMSNSGCLFDFAFTIDTIDPLQLSLSSESINQITANATGGRAPYTYYFEDENGTTANTYTIDRNGAFFVRVVDSNGCEATATIALNLVDISIPNFFTPNNDGQNDFWKPRNTEGFPDIETYIFDRYGRKIRILQPLDKGWDGTYESKPLPSGDYWYIVRLNDGTGREYVGHFTLYR